MLYWGETSWESMSLVYLSLFASSCGNKKGIESNNNKLLKKSIWVSAAQKKTLSCLLVSNKLSHA